MPLADRYQLPLRLPHDLAGRLRREVGLQGETVNAYVKRAIEQRLDMDEARRKERQAETPRGQKNRKAPPGLGLMQPLLPPEQPRPASEPSAPVVVNVGGAGAHEPAGSGLITGLAAHITAGAPWERDRRLKHALEVIGAAYPTLVARKAAEQQLQQAVAAQAQEQAQAQERRRAVSFNPIGSLFRT